MRLTNSLVNTRVRLRVRYECECEYTRYTRNRFAAALELISCSLALSLSLADKSHLDIFSNRPQPKKKRKSRTAFTNHQIFELEKRFLYQKYLSPADRDEIAASLGLSNAQVITWFQNRRAKQKRDIEELKKDFDSVKVFSAHKSFLENVNDLSILKKKPMHEADMVGLAAAAAAAGMVGVPVPVPVPVSAAAQAMGTPPK